MTQRERPEPDRVTLQSLTDRAKTVLPRCLTIEQRKDFLLRPAPPRWCIEMGKYPYAAQAWRTNDVTDDAIAKEYGNFADAAKAGDFPKALEAAELAMKFGPGVSWLKVNRAHALMFVGRFDEARAEYIRHRGTELAGYGVWEDVIIDEFAKLRENGREHALMKDIEKLFQTPLPKR